MTECPAHTKLFTEWLMSGDSFTGTIEATRKLQKHMHSCKECLENMRFATVNTSSEFQAVSNERINGLLTDANLW